MIKSTRLLPNGWLSGQGNNIILLCSSYLCCLLTLLSLLLYTIAITDFVGVRNFQHVAQLWCSSWTNFRHASQPFSMLLGPRIGYLPDNTLVYTTLVRSNHLHQPAGRLEFCRTSPNFPELSSVHWVDWLTYKSRTI